MKVKKKKSETTTAAVPQSSSLVKYETYTEDDARSDGEELEKSKKRGAFLTLQQGRNVVRFLPSLPGKPWKRVTYVHYVTAAGTGERASFVCPRLEARRPCKVCKAEQDLLKTGNRVDEEKAKKLKAKRRCFSNVIARGQEADGPKVFAYGTMIEEQLVELRRDEGVDFLNPTDDGRDLIVLRKGEQMATKYKVKEGDAVSLSDDVKETNEWISGQRDLERYAKVLSDDDIDAILRGERPGQKDEDEDDREERPQPKPKSKPSRTAADEVEDADFDDDDAMG